MERCVDMLERPVSEAMYPAHLRKIGEHRIAEYLEDLMSEVDTHEEMFLELCEAKRKLAEPVRHGVWKPVMLKNVSGQEFVYRHACSICHEYTLCEHANYDPEEELSNYCPNCGAKMDAEAEG